jgi:hypothetical protein
MFDMENLSSVQDSTQRLTDKDWNVSDVFDRRVLKSSSWCDIEEYYSLDERTGVFIFVNLLFQVKYIGKADEGRMIAEIHDAIIAGKSNGALLIKVLYTRSYDKTDTLQKDLVIKYNPMNNLR